MLTITIPGGENFDDETNTFSQVPDVELQFEHSLVSLSKWEAIFEKPFLGKEPKNTAETYGYVKAMCLTPEVPPEVFLRLTNDNLNQINEYINSKMTATWFRELPSRAGARQKEVITSELIYYWIFTMQIPLESENWHLNRLFTLMRVFNQKNAKPQKMGRKEMMEQRRLLNEQRKAELQTRG